MVVQRNLDRLSRSIDALLDFSRMDMGRIALSIQPFSLQALVEQIHTTVRSELEKKRLTFVADIDPALPAVIADREKLSAVLENLVINAIKFTPGGRPHHRGRARGPRAGARSVGRDPRRRHRDRHTRRPDRPHLQPLPPGGRLQHAALRRGRARPRHREEHPGGPRLDHHRGEQAGEGRRLPLRAPGGREERAEGRGGQGPRPRRAGARARGRRRPRGGAHGPGLPGERRPAGDRGRHRGQRRDARRRAASGPDPARPHAPRSRRAGASP